MFVRFVKISTACFFCVLFFVYNIHAQIITDLPKSKPKTEAPKSKPKSTPAPEPKTKSIPTAVLKFTTDAACKILIDGEFKEQVQADDVVKVRLTLGEYLVKFVGENEADSYSEIIAVTQTGLEKLYTIKLQSIINQRLQAEAELQRKKEAEAAKLKLFNFIDYFDDNRNDWALANDANKQIKLTDGKLMIEGVSDKYSYYSVKNFNVDLKKDYVFSITAKWKSGVNNKGFGLNFSSNFTTKTFYVFYISANGYYMISNVNSSGDWVDIKSWTKSSYINQNSLPNLLRVEKKGNYVNFYINDQFITNMVFDGGYGNSFGIRVSSNQTVEFDNFELKNVEP